MLLPEGGKKRIKKKIKKKNSKASRLGKKIYFFKGVMTLYIEKSRKSTKHIKIDK